MIRLKIIAFFNRCTLLLCYFETQSLYIQIDRVLKKFKDHNVSSLDRLEQGEHPQSFSGIIAKRDSVLIAPVSGKECVYYHTVCEEEVQKTREITKDGKKETQTYNEWVHKFTHVESVDFLLADKANPTVTVIVPITGSSLKSHSTVDAFKKSYKHGSVYPQHLSVSRMINIAFVP